MNLSRDIQFGFKGGRDYVHGTDIYAALRDRVFDEPPTEIRTLSMHDLLRHDARLIDVQEEAGHGMAAQVSIPIGGENRRFVLQPTTPVSMSPREYPEDRIVDAGDLDSEGGRLAVETGFDSIEEVIALIKGWSNQYRPISGKWLFVRIDSVDGSPPLPASRRGVLEIRHDGGLAKKLNRFKVSCDEAAAIIFFGAHG